jgi:hypothetical protein
VSVPVEGDGETSYLIPGGGVVYRPTKDLAKILPGDYEIIGRRTGFQDVVFPLRVRNGEPPPTISVACTVPVQE